MQLTINIPDIIPNDKVLKLISQIEEVFEKEDINCEITHEISVKDDPWDSLDIEKTSVDIDIENFAENRN